MGKSWKRFRIRRIGSNLPAEVVAPIAAPIVEAEIVVPVAKTTTPKPTPLATKVPAVKKVKKVSSDASKTS